LEVEVGAALFRRVPHGAELTEAGSAFLGGIRDMPIIAERATLAARRAARGETGLLRVGFTASAAFNVVVPAAIRAFRRAYAGVQLTLEETNTTRLVDGLSEGSLDAVFLRPGAPGSENFQLRQLSEEPMLVAPSETHPCAARTEIDLLALKNEPFLLFPRAVGPTLDDTIIGACQNAGFEPVVEQLAPQIASVVNLVAAELGVSVVPASMSQLRVTGVAYRRIAGQSPIARLALAYRRGETSVVVRNFITRAVS
jgi:DNA-binding transcriptional LysR family regulator